MWRRPYSCAELALGYGRAGGDSQRQGKKVSRGFFNAAAVPADAVSHRRRGKRGARIEQRREDRTHVSKHQSREGDGCGVSGLLPPSRWHLGKNRAGRRERRGGNTLSGINGGWKGGKRKLGRRGDAGGFEGVLRKSAQVQGLGREQGNSSWVRTAFAHLLQGHERHRPRRGDTEDLRGRRL